MSVCELRGRKPCGKLQGFMSDPGKIAVIIKLNNLLSYV
jgi:hypothetical protein